MTTKLATSDNKNVSSRLRIGRIIGGAFLLELVLSLALVPPLQIFGPDKVIPLIYPAVVVISFGVTWLILRKVPQRPVMHGALIGIVATAIYILLCFVNPEGISAVIAMYGVFGFISGNGLRILSCVAGGYAIQRRNEGRTS